MYGCTHINLYLFNPSIYLPACLSITGQFSPVQRYKVISIPISLILTPLSDSEKPGSHCSHCIYLFAQSPDHTSWKSDPGHIGPSHHTSSSTKHASQQLGTNEGKAFLCLFPPLGPKATQLELRGAGFPSASGFHSCPDVSPILSSNNKQSHQQKQFCLFLVLPFCHRDSNKVYWPNGGQWFSAPSFLAPTQAFLIYFPVF